MELKHLLLIFIVSVAIGVVFTGDSDEYEEYFLDGFEFSCEKPGYKCNGCNESYFCVQNGDGSFKPELIEACQDKNKTCHKETGQCTTGQNLECDPMANDYILKCRNKGMFPHPFHCNEYYVCCDIDATPPVTECPKDFDYDPLTTLCNKYLKNCTTPAKPCTVAGDIGPIVGNPSMYYLCLPQTNGLVTPQMYLCPTNQTFMGSGCKAPASGLDDDGLCSSFGHFHEASSPRLYNECASVGQEPVTMVCPGGSIFSPNKGQCD